MFHTNPPTAHAGFDVVPLKLRNYWNLAQFFLAMAATAAFVAVLVFYIVTDHALLSGTSVTSRSLTYALLVLGYISKGYLAIMSITVIQCVKNAISDGLLEEGVSAAILVDSVYNTDQNLGPLPGASSAHITIGRSWPFSWCPSPCRASARPRCS